MTETFEDRRGNSVPVLKPASGSAYETAIGAASASATVTHEVLSFYATADCYIKLGSGSATAAAGDYDFMLPAGAIKSIEMQGLDTVACIQVSAAGVLYINGEE